VAYNYTDGHKKITNRRARKGGTTTEMLTNTGMIQDCTECNKTF